MSYSIYYQAKIDKAKTWFFTSILRSFENLCFDRTVDPEKGIFEFFVSPGCEEEFLMVMKYFENINIVSDLKNLPNRFES